MSGLSRGTTGAARRSGDEPQIVARPDSFAVLDQMLCHATSIALRNARIIEQAIRDDTVGMTMLASIPKTDFICPKVSASFLAKVDKRDRVAYSAMCGILRDADDRHTSLSLSILGSVTRIALAGAFDTVPLVAVQLATSHTQATAVRKHGGGRAPFAPLTQQPGGRRARSIGGETKSLCCAAAGIIALASRPRGAHAHPLTGVRRAAHHAAPLRSMTCPHAQPVEGYQQHKEPMRGGA